MKTMDLGVQTGPALRGVDLNIPDLCRTCIGEGVALFDLPGEYRSEVDAVARRVGATEENYTFDTVKRLAPNILRGLVAPLEGLISGHTTTSLISQPRRDPQNVSRLHVDGVISSGVSVIVPVSGPSARFYHADSAEVFPNDELDSVVYGVGQAVLLRQFMHVKTTPDDHTRLVEPRSHGGWCEDGDRELLTFDIHGDGVVTVSDL